MNVNQWKSQIYHTVRTDPNYNLKVEETEVKSISVKHICMTAHDHPSGTATSCGRVKLVSSAQQSPISELMWSWECFPRSWLITGFATRLTRWVSLVEQKLLTLPEFIPGGVFFGGGGSSYSIFSFICMFCWSFFVLCTFSFGHCVVCSSSIYGFWLPFWYLQTLLPH
jgi:hypothetical protein